MNIVCNSNPQRLLLLFISATIPAMYLTRTRNKKHIQRHNDDSFISTKISQNYPKLVANYRDIFSLTYNLAIIYTLTQRFKIELCRPVEACIMSDSPLRRVYPTLIYAAPSQQVGINLGLLLIMNLGQLVYHYLTKNQIYL